MLNINEFRKALQFVLKWEGSYSNDPNDPGGETKWGISKRSYPNLDIKNLTPEQALQIYAKDYWDALDCDSYSYPNALALFDSAVNCGVNRTKSWLQRANQSPKPSTIHDEVLTYRKEYYDQLLRNTSWARKYHRGWINRLTALRKEIDIALQDY